MLLSGVKLFSWKRLAASVPVALLLFIAAEYIAGGTGLYDGSSRWDLRECLGAILLPAAFIPDRFTQIRSGFLVIEELQIVLPAQLAYAYFLLSLGALALHKVRTGGPR